MPVGTDAQPVRVAAENDAAALTNQAVTKETPDTTAPALESATVGATSLALICDEALDEGLESAASGFSVSVGRAYGTWLRVAARAARRSPESLRDEA